MKRIHLLALSLFIVSIGPLNARVTQLEIIETIPIANGKKFGDIGAYEKISGIAYFEIAPDHKRNKTIADINRAPVNANGNIEFSAEFEILRPVNSQKASGVLFIETPSQGQKLSLGLLHDIDAQKNLNLINEQTDLGNGFLFNRGHTLAWIAWQGKISDVDHRLTVNFPLALGNEDSIGGFILTEFNGRSFEDKNPYTLPLSGRQYIQSYPSISTDKDIAKASLFVMQSGSTDASSTDVGKGEMISDEQWDFAYCPEGWPGEPSLEYICVKNSFLKNRKSRVWNY